MMTVIIGGRKILGVEKGGPEVRQSPVVLVVGIPQQESGIEKNENARVAVLEVVIEKENLAEVVTTAVEMIDLEAV